ncbi:uncharacterized protein BO95DRAFT_103085 [Aspergillus brunneoviolaceus CBS 621.78]|uniref:Uncharacterized protein n=1 Tax=Aspergillus brunneoviolaceus CBS 621.78 TaxID=1450534 RepID=A0ACD1GB58_9EURO|nr:hypothetical protein BO95DRAFT_103085 [Aspergillus brunneoviolaceus CBS 621.78]RAH46530.1 hypothetical protein BO95DRAFT_103085 [Aspergillus brunneoviolaceus CBS 621.78]
MTSSSSCSSCLLWFPISVRLHPPSTIFPFFLIPSSLFLFLFLTSFAFTLQTRNLDHFRSASSPPLFPPPPPPPPPSPPHLFPLQYQKMSVESSFFLPFFLLPFFFSLEEKSSCVLEVSHFKVRDGASPSVDCPLGPGVIMNHTRGSDNIDIFQKQRKQAGQQHRRGYHP